jgi:hypothetical protein
MYIEKYEEDTDHIENVCVLPTRNHVAVAYRPHCSQVQAIKIYSLGREDPISIQIFHENEKAGSIKLIIFSPSEPKFMVHPLEFSASFWVSLTPNCSTSTLTKISLWLRVVLL